MKHSRTFIIKLPVLWIVFLSLLIHAKGFTQNTELIFKAKELVDSNPDEALKISEHILNTSQNIQEKVESNIIRARSYIVKGEYNETVPYIFDSVNFSEHINKKAKAEINIIAAKLFRTVYLDKQAELYLSNTKNILESSQLNPKLEDSLKAIISLEEIYMKLDRGEDNIAIELANIFEKEHEDFIKKNINSNISFLLAKEKAFNRLMYRDSARIYINRIFNVLDLNSYSNILQKSIVYNELGQLYLQNKDFNKSEETLFIASKFAEIIDNPSIMRDINKGLAINYLASNKKIQHKTYNDKFLALSSQVDLIEQETVNSLYNTLSGKLEENVTQQQSRYKNYLYLAIAGLVIAFIISLFVTLKYIERKKRLKEIIKYLEISKNNSIAEKKPKKVNSKKGIHIPEETEMQILEKLKRFENSKMFLHKEMSLARLAGKFETNTKYLSGVINNHYDDNFNTFINKLRINYIIDKLRNDPNYINYKISYLAEECGFSSHSSFATVFKSIVGMSPVTLIKLIKEERKNGKPEVVN